jgi:hypothetical protein
MWRTSSVLGAAVALAGCASTKVISVDNPTYSVCKATLASDAYHQGQLQGHGAIVYSQADRRCYQWTCNDNKCTAQQALSSAFKYCSDHGSTDCAAYAKDFQILFPRYTSQTVQTPGWTAADTAALVEILSAGVAGYNEGKAAARSSYSTQPTQTYNQQNVAPTVHPFVPAPLTSTAPSAPLTSNAPVAEGGCSSDVECGVGITCVKPVGQINLRGVCRQLVNQVGSPVMSTTVHTAPVHVYGCHFNTECQVGWYCSKQQNELVGVCTR